MMFFVVIVVAGAVLLVLTLGGKGKQSKPSIQASHQESTAAKSTPSPSSRKGSSPNANFDGDDDNDDDGDDGWVAKLHKVGTFPRPAGMVPLPGMSSVILKGTAHRVKEVKPFLEMMRADKPLVSFRFERETTNNFDKNAIRIWGTGHRGGEFNLGYVPAESAKAIADTYSEAMPIAVELVSSGYTSAEDAAYVKMRLLGPSAVERKKFLKQ